MTLQDLLSEAKKLDVQQQIQLATQLMQWVEIHNKKSPNNLDQKLRTPGLHLGSCIFGDDFDDPLPDEFWLGES